MVRWWIPTLCSFEVAAITGFLIWKKWRYLTGIHSFALNFACHLIFFTFFFTGAFYSLNYVHTGTPYKEKGVVVAKIRETHYRTRRVGRNRYVRDNTPYYEYYVKTSLPDGHIKKLHVPIDMYRNIRKGDTLRLSFAKGMLGCTVLRAYDLTADNPQYRMSNKVRRRHK